VNGAEAVSALAGFHQQPHRSASGLGRPCGMRTARPLGVGALPLTKRGTPMPGGLSGRGVERSSDGLRRRQTGLSRRLAGPSFEGMREGADFLVTE
jgi:hypothetical protein